MITISQTRFLDFFVRITAVIIDFLKISTF